MADDSLPFLCAMLLVPVCDAAYLQALRLANDEQHVHRAILVVPQPVPWPPGQTLGSWLHYALGKRRWAAQGQWKVRRGREARLKSPTLRPSFDTQNETSFSNAADSLSVWLVGEEARAAPCRPRATPVPPCATRRLCVWPSPVRRAARPLTAFGPCTSCSTGC